MKHFMTKLFLGATLLTSTIFAGGDIEPVEPAMEPVTSTGDALTFTTMIILVAVTTLIGLYAVRKQQTAN